MATRNSQEKKKKRSQYVKFAKPNIVYQYVKIIYLYVIFIKYHEHATC